MAGEAGDENEPSQEHLQLLYDELKAALQLQLEELSALDNKAVGLLTPVGVVLGFGVASLGHIGPSVWARGFFYAGLSILLVSFANGIYALRLRQIRYAPTAAIWPVYATVSTRTMLEVECATVAEVFDSNGGIRGLKTPWVARQFWALLIGAIVLAIGFGFQVAGILT
ncbi:MAG: hypothetical protein M3Z57_02690 [Candidatus Dormibacteraeota bacterium]|jgi:hypothetical protein|nr:hypothetical protein [Candidatus Dormibacteraeota bacterium]